MPQIKHTNRDEVFNALRKELVDDSFSNTFGESLLNSTSLYWKKYGEDERKIKLNEDQRPERLEQNTPTKTKALEALKDKVEKISEEEGEGLSFPGGKIEVGPKKYRRNLEALDSTSKIVEHEQMLLPDSAVSKNLNPKIIFLGHPLFEEIGEIAEGSHTESGDLLGKMIKAMGLASEDILRLPLKRQAIGHGLCAFNYEVLSLIFHFNPIFVVTLGAASSNILLSEKVRLTSVHGEFFQMDLTKNKETRSFTVTPLFHPEYLLINPNMKRAAWSDLQKIMSAFN